MEDENLISLYKSLKNHGGPKIIYKCDICMKIYQQKDSIVRHLNKKHLSEFTGKTEYCHICDRDFPISYHEMPNFKFHIITVHGNIVFDGGLPEIECNICQKRFATKVYFRHHWETHRIAKQPVVCTKCTKVFPNMYLYKIHVSQAHQTCICPLCDKVFGGKLILRRHMIKHENPFTCGYCYKGFENDEILEKHKKEHLIERDKIICDICGMTTSYKSVMKRHIMTHNVGRSNCDLCGKSFKTISSLKHHQATIHGSKEFKCLICPTEFAQKALLTKHVKMKHDNDEILFESCPYCDKMMNKYQMVTHLFKHTKESLFECPICKDRFKAKRTLIRHQAVYNHH